MRGKDVPQQPDDTEMEDDAVEERDGNEDNYTETEEYGEDILLEIEEQNLTYSEQETAILKEELACFLVNNHVNK